MVQSIAENTEDALMRRIPMTREEQLELANNGSPEDEQLCRLILAVWATERGTKARKLAIDRLLPYVQRSPQMLKSRHPSYLEALNQTWMWLVKHIDAFDPTTPSKKGKYIDGYNPEKSLTDSFFRWVRTTGMWRLRDFKVDKATSEEISLDNSFENDEGGYFTPEQASTEPDSIAEILNRRLGNDFQIKLERYLESDPEGRFVACYLNENPQCNCYALVQRLVLAVPPIKKQAIADEFNVNYSTMNYFWIRKCQKLLKEITNEIADSLGYDIN